MKPILVLNLRTFDDGEIVRLLEEGFDVLEEWQARFRRNVAISGVVTCPDSLTTTGIRRVLGLA